MSNLVEVVKSKFDGSVRSVWAGEVVARRASWLVVHHDGAVHWKRGPANEAEEVPAHALHYLAEGAPLIVLFAFDGDGRWQDTKCDAAMPFRAGDDGGSLNFVDLDLDVIIERGALPYARDYDQFAERIQTMGYTPEVVSAAHEGIRLARQLIADRELPFDGSPEQLLRDLLDRKRRP